MGVGTRILSSGSGVTSAQLAAVQAQIPTAAAVAPPGDSATGTAGAASPYARADHNHPSTTQAARMAVSGSSGLITWTFPIAFANPPLVMATVENVANATNPYVVNIVGQATTTSVTLQVFKASSSTLPGIALNLLGYVVNIFGNAAAGTYINVIARALPT